MKNKLTIIKIFISRNRWLILVSVCLSFFFYWSQYRPVQIREKCAIRHMHQDAQVILPHYYGQLPDVDTGLPQNLAHILVEKIDYNRFVATSTTPAKDWNVYVPQATYLYCLHANGL